MAYLQDQVVGLIERYIAENGHLDYVAYPADLAKAIVDGIVSKSGYDPARDCYVIVIGEDR